MPKDKPIGDAFKECIRMLEATKSQATVRMYRRALGEFANALFAEGRTQCWELTLDNFISQVGRWGGSVLSSSSKRVYVSALSFFLNFLTTMGYIIPTFPDMERYKNAIKQWVGKVKGKQKIVTPQQIELVIDVARRLAGSPGGIVAQRNLVVVEFMFATGCRVSELVSIDVEDIDFENRTISIIGKGEKQRFILFNKRTNYFLESYLAMRSIPPDIPYPMIARHNIKDMDYLEITTSSIRKIVADLSREAGFEKGQITPHSFRHAFAVKMLEETGNLALVQDLLGHSSPETTRIYAKYTQSALQEEYRKVWEGE